MLAADCSHDPANLASRSTPARTLRVILIVLGLGAWFGTQELISQRGFPEGGIGDGLFDLLAPVHAFLLENYAWANALLIASSAVIDLLGVFLLGWSIFGPSVRPFLGLLILFSLRQLCQAMCALPQPPEMIWRPPGFPSLLVTYGVSNDLFFSGHTAIAVYGAIELGRLGSRGLVAVGFAIGFFEATTVLALRAHWTMDVYAGAVTAMCIALLASRLAPACDQALARIWPRAHPTD